MSSSGKYPRKISVKFKKLEVRDGCSGVQVKPHHLSCTI